jgi:hypothetical protein
VEDLRAEVLTLRQESAHLRERAVTAELHASAPPPAHGGP